MTTKNTTNRQMSDDRRFYSGYWYCGTLSTDNYRFAYIRKNNQDWGDVDIAEKKTLAAHLVECQAGGCEGWKWCSQASPNSSKNLWGCAHQQLYDTGLRCYKIHVCALPNARELAEDRELDCAIGML